MGEAELLAEAGTSAVLGGGGRESRSSGTGAESALHYKGYKGYNKKCSCTEKGRESGRYEDEMNSMSSRKGDDAESFEGDVRKKKAIVVLKRAQEKKKDGANWPSSRQNIAARPPGAASPNED